MGFFVLCSSARVRCISLVHQCSDNTLTNYSKFCLCKHCAVFSSNKLQVFPSFLTCHCFSPFGQRETQESEISSSLCREARTAEVTAKDHGFMPLEELKRTLSLESLDVKTLCYDTVDEGCVKYFESG